MDIKNCIICKKEISKNRLQQNKITCSKSCAIKYALSNLEIKKKHSLGIKKAYENPELRQKASERNKQTLNRPDVKEKHRKSLKNRWSDINARKELSNIMKEVYKNPEIHEKISKKVKDAYENTELRQKMSDTMKEVYKNPELKQKMSDTMKEVYKNPEIHEKISKKVKDAWPRIIETKRKNGTLSSSKPEKFIKELLEQRFNKVHYQYKCERYPFNCDFYIEDIDLFIELNFHWTHGFMPYDENNEQCQIQLKQWQEKAKTSKYWQSAINIWMFYDVQKLFTFIDNKLNYKIFYTWNDFTHWYNLIKKGDTKCY